MSRRIFLFFSSLVFLVYILAPVAWLLSSSFQGEAEITSRPPHWIPHEPTLENFAAIFQARDRQVTYENRRQGDPATGGFIPSTARDLIPSMWNSFVVAVAVVLAAVAIAFGLDTGVLARLSTASTTRLEQALFDALLPAERETRSGAAMMAGAPMMSANSATAAALPVEGDVPALDGLLARLQEDLPGHGARGLQPDDEPVDEAASAGT